MSKRGQPRVYKRLTLTTLATLIGLGGAAQAETYGGGPVFAANGVVVACRVFNFGATPVTLPTLEIYNSLGATVAQTFNNCPAPPADLPLGGTCAFAATAVANTAYSCRLVVAGQNPDRVSGAAEIQATGGTVLNALPLTK